MLNFDKTSYFCLAANFIIRALVSSRWFPCFVFCPTFLSTLSLFLSITVAFAVYCHFGHVSSSFASLRLLLLLFSIKLSSVRIPSSCYSVCTKWIYCRIKCTRTVESSDRAPPLCFSSKTLQWCLSPLSFPLLFSSRLFLRLSLDANNFPRQSLLFFLLLLLFLFVGGYSAVIRKIW